MCRSWFQDPGMIEHHGLYNSPRTDIETLPKISGPLARLSFDDTNYASYSAFGGLNEIYSPYYNSSISEIKLLLWAGEKVDLCLSATVAVDHPNDTPARGATYGLYLALDKNTVSSNISKVRHTTAVLTHGLANANSLGYHQGIGLTDSYVAETDGLYRLKLLGITSHNDTKGYLVGHQYAGGEDKSVLSMALSQYHAYRNLAIAAILPPGETRTLAINSNVNNYNVYTEFVNQYGSFSAIPLLTTLYVELNNGIVLGSNSVTSGGMFVSNAIPSGVQVIINVGPGCYLVGKGGKGADNANGSGFTDTPEPGGDAIVTERNITVNINGGVLGGGGGGGQRGRTGTSGATGSDGGPGGGGAGFNHGEAGDRYRTSPLGGDDTAANAATSSSLTSGGLGGIAIYAGPRNGNFSRGDDGGAGGNLGQPGNPHAGNAIAEVGTPPAPGAAGRAIKINGSGVFVTVNVNSGAVYGAY